MPRRSRLMLPGVPVHIVHRGNNRQACFRELCDRSFYLFHLRRLLAPSRCALHAYCLMTNHVHLLLTPLAAPSCAQLMKDLSQLHTQYMNRTYGRTGSLWEGRFRSCLIQAEDYLLACYRYVELNPVRARLCARPRDYEWSSYRVNAEGTADQAITPHEQYASLAITRAARLRAYEELFATDPASWRTDEIRAATNGNFALGDEIFKRKLSIALGRRVERGRPGRRASTATDNAQLDLLASAANVVRAP